MKPVISHNRKTTTPFRKCSNTPRMVTRATTLRWSSTHPVLVIWSKICTLSLQHHTKRNAITIQVSWNLARRISRSHIHRFCRGVRVWTRGQSLWVGKICLMGIRMLSRYQMLLRNSLCMQRTDLRVWEKSESFRTGYPPAAVLNGFQVKILILIAMRFSGIAQVPLEDNLKKAKQVLGNQYTMHTNQMVS